MTRTEPPAEPIPIRERLVLLNSSYSSCFDIAKDTHTSNKTSFQNTRVMDNPSIRAKKHATGFCRQPRDDDPHCFLESLHFGVLVC